jgi:DNA ligase-associated metallophosphoesterase
MIRAEPTTEQQQTATPPGLPPGACVVPVAGRPLALLPDRCAWLPDRRWLLVADVHLGKAHSFRRLGVPVPAGTTAATLDRLARLTAALRPARLVILGDLLHGPAARQPALLDALARWRRGCAGTEVTLVRGNHDARAGDPPPGCGIETVEGPLRDGDLWLCHDPAEAPAGNAADGGPQAIAGHVHPQYRLRASGDSLRLPCYWARERVTVLPAFGEFTGGFTLRPEDGGTVYVTDGRAVHPVPRTPSGWGPGAGARG